MGEPLRPYFHRLLEALRIPAEKQAAAAAACPKLACGRYYILPSFFRLVNHLEADGRDFHIVFRTFGVDIAEVAQEWNLFCDGRHPLFAPARPELTAERRLELPRDSGAIYRTETDDMLRDGVHLAMVSPAKQVGAKEDVG